ncbi:hypothetical protein [Acinetobacter seifertii]|uniref:Barstar family protein n=1 Tax=Acinetobacter seifertii TaxID=1530123 RepID=A0A7H2VB11_9GAMM|nr:hypothetical protein [Acinetobacter seifertii]MBZ6532453.1 hypothetical protein [Acinetobacter seifertii]QNW90281.1 hypothetical protein IC799_11570 [Acinetobacter seifertii]QNX73544.1 hypothetical protein IC776_06735 [Acinetobacter seifertii]
MFSLNICKLIPEDGEVEVLVEFFFRKILIKNNTVVVKELFELYKAIESLNCFKSIFLKDKFSLYFIRILSRKKVATESGEINLIHRLNLSNSFNSHNDSIFIEFESDALENNLEEFNIFQKKEELLNLLENDIVRKKRWFNLTKFEKNLWLDFAYSKEGGNLSPLNLNLIIDGNYIMCAEDLYCYLGEEIYGVLGYLAYNSNAFADAISELSLKIKWINFENSRKKFDSKEDLEYLVSILKQYSSLVLK